MPRLWVRVPPPVPDGPGPRGRGHFVFGTPTDRRSAVAARTGCYTWRSSVWRQARTIRADGRVARERLDRLLVARGLAESRERAQAMILAGIVRVDGEIARRAALPVADAAEVEVAERLPFVSRGGLKLAHALDQFGLDPRGQTLADVGASTGGFTDCLLQRGAARVYAIDDGRGQLDWRLRRDGRVVVMERTHARDLANLPE